MMNDTFYERKTGGIAADFIHDPAYGLSMLVNSLYNVSTAFSSRRSTRKL